MSPVDTVVFDLGNVLITWDREFLYGSVIEDPERRRYFLDHVLTLSENGRLDRGLGLGELVDDLTARHPEWRDELDAFRHRWIETIGPTIDGTVAILDELAAADVPVYALSNFGAETFEQVKHHYPFFAHFRGMVISGFEGVLKPEPAIFELLLHRYDLAARQCLFIDDSAANVDGARAVGLEGHHFVDSERLRRDLVGRGLLSGPT